MFNINSSIDQCRNISNLINLLTPHVNILRKYCITCKTSIPYITIADIAYLIVQNIKEWTLAIDINVYSNNHQFRFFNTVKYGKNNPLVPSTIFPSDRQLQYSSFDLLKKSFITFIDNNYVSKIYFRNNKFMIGLSSLSHSLTILSHNSININLINKHIDYSASRNLYTNIDTAQNPLNTLHDKKINSLDLSIDNTQIFTSFIKNIITSDPSHQGYIYSCARGIYNKNLLFFNIAGNYRYCPKKNGHHQRNTIAVMINTKNYTYCIRCKDKECNNTILSWKKIK